MTKILNPLKNKTNQSWFFEQQIYNQNGITRAVKSTAGSGNVPKVIIYDDYNQNIPKNQDVIGTITKQFGNTAPRNGWKIIETMAKETNINLQLPKELEGKKFRIRKLTPRECFRLMGVDDKDIDKMQASGLSNSAQYKLAGNSIVVDVLYHLFRKMFVQTESENQQLTLF